MSKAMNTCKTCRHWSTKDRADTVARACTFAGTEVTDDGIAILSSGFAAEEACNGLGDRVSPDVLTGPDFGCIHHEEKNRC